MAAVALVAAVVAVAAASACGGPVWCWREVERPSMVASKGSNYKIPFKLFGSEEKMPMFNSEIQLQLQLHELP